MPDQATPAPRPHSGTPTSLTAQAASPAATSTAAGSFTRGLGAGAGAGVGLGVTITVGMVISSLMFGVFVLIGAMRSTSTAPDVSTIWGPENAASTIYAVRINGVIMADASDGTTLAGGTYGYEIAKEIDGLNAQSAAGLLLIVNTPGGSINGSAAIADAVARYQQRTKKKVVVHVQGMAASGGMYAMSGADEIIADHGSLIGSIGVIMGPFVKYKNVTGTTGTIFTEGVQTSGGITEEYLTMGRGKDLGNPYRSMSPEERQILTAGLANEYQAFVNRVAAGRHLQPAVITGRLGAHIFDPKTAIANGLIDKELGIDDAYRRAAEVMGVDPNKTKIVSPSSPSALAQLLGAQSRIPGHAVALSQGEKPSPTICGSTPRAMVYYGEPATVCG